MLRTCKTTSPFALGPIFSVLSIAEHSPFTGGFSEVSRTVKKPRTESSSGETPVAIPVPSTSLAHPPQSDPVGHFYFGKNRTFLNWLDISGVSA